MIQGIYTPNLVPFTEDGRINEPELRRMITLVGKEKIGAAYVTVMVRGDVAAVAAAVEAGVKAVGDLGKFIAAHVIARPHPDLIRLLPPALS